MKSTVSQLQNVSANYSTLRIDFNPTAHAESEVE